MKNGTQHGSDKPRGPKQSTAESPAPALSSQRHCVPWGPIVQLWVLLPGGLPWSLLDYSSQLLFQKHLFLFVWIYFIYTCVHTHRHQSTALFLQGAWSAQAFHCFSCISFRGLQEWRSIYLWIRLTECSLQVLQIPLYWTLCTYSEVLILQSKGNPPQWCSQSRS